MTRSGGLVQPWPEPSSSSISPSNRCKRKKEKDGEALDDRPPCPVCGQTDKVNYKESFPVEKGGNRQRFICKRCKKRFNDLTGTLTERMRILPQAAIKGLLLFGLGLSKTSAARGIGRACRRTVTRLLERVTTGEHTEEIAEILGENGWGGKITATWLVTVAEVASGRECKVDLSDNVLRAAGTMKALQRDGMDTDDVINRLFDTA